LLPFATAWIAQTEFAQLPVIVYAWLFVVTDGFYNLFENEVLRTSSDFSKTEFRLARRRSLVALGFFVVAACLALINSWLGFGFVCLALALHLRPDANAWRRRRKGAEQAPAGDA
jgi:uncharacterized membrane protein